MMLSTTAQADGKSLNFLAQEALKKSVTAKGSG
jgi:predicted HicB family RNase H-like nuclease